MKTADRNREGLTDDPFWYKSGVIYEVHVRAFCDSTGDGTGDFGGLTQKLDYLKDLGVTAVWLLPFYPSPLRDDGYDIADYYDVHPMYGKLADFKGFLREAHRRGLRVITELVLNHTSDKHPWFQRSRRAKPGSRWRNFYVWSDDPHRYQAAHIVFKDVENSNWTWDPLAKTYFWHRFFSHQPDLNYDNPEVHEAMFKVVDFWLDLGVDGLRLDAVPYLYEREGTACENLPETHAFLKKLRAHVDQKYGDRMLLAEANLWPEDAVTYFGQGRGDECHMAFHFPLMPRLFMAVRMEDRLPIVDILEQTPAIPETSQWALFLRNHDELTLSTVTDEERDYMYRMYAQVHQARLNLGIRRRLAPLLGNDRKKIELLNALLFSLPGTPVLYYGDEIGLGENIYLGDRNGVRTPMQWSSDKNAGFSRANPQSLYLPIILDPVYHYEACNVEAQLANPHSLLWWMRRLLALRKRWRALGEGKCEFLQPDNRKVLSYVLRHEQEILLVVANLSRFSQPVELDLSAFAQRVPVELFGRTEFPVIAERPYFLSLGPHSFHWFSLEPQRVLAPAGDDSGTVGQSPTLAVTGDLQELFTGQGKTKLEILLPGFLRRQAWFAGKNKTIKTVTLRVVIPMALPEAQQAFFTCWSVDYVQGDAETYALPLVFSTGPEAAWLRWEWPHLIVANLNLTQAVAGKPSGLGVPRRAGAVQDASALSPEQAESGSREMRSEAQGVSGDKSCGILVDAVACSAFGQALLALIQHRRRLKGNGGEVEATRMPALRPMLENSAPSEPSLRKGEQRNSTLVYGDKVVLKLFRRLDAGINSELELGRFLTSRNFPHHPPLLGALELAGAGAARSTLGVLHQFVLGGKSAWDFTLDALGRYFDRVITWVAQDRPVPSANAEPFAYLSQEIPAAVSESLGTFLESARVLGVRIAGLHLALASDADDPAFAPEPFSPQYQRGVFQTMRNLAVQNLGTLRRQLKELSPDDLPLAERVAGSESVIIQSLRQLLEPHAAAQRIRIHGDLHLGQLLWTGRDFVITDFEGDVTAALTERTIKRSPLRDAASLMRSFHYAAYAGLCQHVERGSIPRENVARFEPWMRHWNVWVSVAFFKAYRQTLKPHDLLPANEAEVRAMFRAYLLNQMMAELGRELDHHSDRLKIPLRGILYLSNEPSAMRVPTSTTDAPASDAAQPVA